MIEISDTTLALAWLTPLVALAGLAATDAFREMFPLRRDLLSRLALVRFYVMLDRRNIGVPAYLHQVPRRRIIAHVQACELCPSKAQCDAALRSSPAADLAFCPNGNDLAALQR